MASAPLDGRDPLWPERMALVHEYLIQAGGSEKVVQALTAFAPQAPLYVSLFSPHTMPSAWQELEIHTSFLQGWAKRLGVLRRDYHARLKYLLPWMPLAYESFDFSGYDCVISSSHAFAKGILTGEQTLHLSYIHSPTRYLWENRELYLERGGLGGGGHHRWIRPAYVLSQWLLHRLRQWDVLAAQRPDLLIANSQHIRRRIYKTYRRDAVVIHPPVPLEGFQPVADPSADYDLVVGRLVPYKRVDLAIAACERLGRRLLIVGEGPELSRLKALAGPLVEFLPHQPQARLQELFAHCRTLLFPWVEDFGLVPVEAQACGRPVIALNRGGTQETVIHGETGIHIPEASVDALVEGLRQADRQEWDPQRIRAHALQFAPARFQAQMGSLLRWAWPRFQVGEPLDPKNWQAQ
ncbi:glycosyltransferase [Thermostichus vulcanus]|uniref:Glycosyltransferase n=1 Tax=Thermostichus vulcanus str. 'Rupite' TaxID=2813851 RepID=A0ABT0CEF3_THEVL|nr:glycosyltransferase [Thermostichus vulcanus]MCJ2544164.1 glycosyltransferase [Thermostichus vulcanus str. 'Rupite']